VADPRFEHGPGDTPFEWDLTPRPGLEYVRRDGLEIRLLGDQNVTDAGVRQHTVVTPGRYRLTTEISADRITTDQGFFFEITDPERPAIVHAAMGPFVGTMARSVRELEVTVPAGTRILRLQLARSASLKFDNKVAGTLKVYRVALERDYRD
jgi:hypothetical protein